ncbi:uncharacterized protein [Mytilus edulis]|uniref:uncharacterized protein n=1 Tax=Mytilus edulis TaxID=6550 RepID=UPI0039EF5B9C
MFTSKTQIEHHCTEGDSIKLTCSVYTDNIKVKWYKDDKELNECTHISITSNGNHRMLTIVETEVIDSGTYFVKAQSVVLEMTLTVKAIFERRLVDMTNMEGLDTILECETVERNCNVQWFKDNVEIINQLDKVKIKKTKERLHTLFISKTSLEDSGTYSIQIKGVKSIAKLDVKEMPETIKLMSIHDREEFLKAAKSGLTKRYAVRVMIVGEKSVGKTCLLRRLINEQISDVNSTDGINIERRKCQIDIETGEWHFLSDDREPQASSDHIKQFADCGFWDFAGQKEFYATHQTFLSANAVYLLVVDISKDLTMKTYNNMIEKEFDAIGEYIDFWLDNIHSYSRDEMNTPKDHKEDHFINPPVIIVGTRIDKLEEVEEKKKNFQHYLSRILSTHVKRRHLRKVHFVSNTRPSDDKQEFKSLREDIFRHAKVLTTWGENIPTRWIVLEKVINTKPSEHVISYTDAENLAMKSSFHNDSQMTLELDSFLKFEHNIGNIIFFEDVRSFIVLDPKWLMDIFRCFVSHQYDDDTIGMPEWSELEQTGKLAYKLIEKLLEKVPDLSTPELKKYILQIMEKFDIIVRPMNDDAKNDFYMPCMIKVEPFLNIIERSESKNYRRTSWFCLKFNFLPPSYFNHILVSFVKRKELFVEKNRRLRIYRNIGEFQLNESGSQTLVVCLSKNAIGMQVRQLNCTEDICFSDVKNILMDIVNSVKQRYGINIAHTIKFKCSEGIYSCKRVDLETLMDIDEYLYKEHETMHTSKGIYSSWLTEEEVDLESKKKSHRRCNYCKNMSVHKCYDCNQVLCEDCLRRHESMYQSHSMQPISDSFILNCIFPLEDVNHGNRLITDIKCLPDGEVVAAVENKDLTELMVFSISGKRRHVIQLDKIPRTIDVVDKNTVSVLIENDSVAIVDIQQNHVQYIWDFAIPYSSDAFIYIENEFYIGDKYGIVVIDMSGSVKRHIKLSFTPYDMCYDVDSQHIYCIGIDRSKLICIDRDGNDIFTFTNPNMTDLTDLTIDNDGNVLVLCEKEDDNSRYSVVKVDFNGGKSEVVITHINTSSSYPCICYDHLTNSVVIGLDNKVYIYKNK